MFWGCRCDGLVGDVGRLGSDPRPELRDDEHHPPTDLGSARRLPFERSPLQRLGTQARQPCGFLLAASDGFNGFYIRREQCGHDSILMCFPPRIAAGMTNDSRENGAKVVQNGAKEIARRRRDKH